MEKSWDSGVGAGLRYRKIYMGCNRETTPNKEHFMLPITLAHVKLAAMLITTTSTSKVVREIIRNNVTTTTKLQAAQVRVGTFFIGSTIADAAWKSTEESIDTAHAMYDGWKQAKHEESQKAKS